MKNVHPNWQTLDDTDILHSLCQSNVKDETVFELLQYYILENDWDPDYYNIIIENKGSTSLHIAFQANKLTLNSYLIIQPHWDSKM